MPSDGDNFVLVYDGRAWHGEAPPERLLALILILLMNPPKERE